jgi:hypothetical protein
MGQRFQCSLGRTLARSNSIAPTGSSWGKCRYGTAPASSTDCTAPIWVTGSTPTVQLASTRSTGFDSAARWISTGLGWSTAPAVNRHRPAASGHEDRWWLRRWVVQFQGVGRKIAARERDSLTGPQLADQLDRLDQPVVAFAVASERVSGGLLVEALAGAQPKKHPPGAQHREGRKSLGYRGRVVAVDRTGHAGAERDSAGSVAHQCQRQPRKHRVALVVLLGLDVVAGPNMLKTGIFGGLSLREELIGAEFLV